jgi:hypothetical protein
VVNLAEDEVLLPGLVDTHVHINEPGRTEWEGFATATRAAAAGGVTTLIDMPLNSIPPTVTLPALRAKQAAARDRCYVDVGFWGGAIESSLGSLGELHEAGVFGFKAFMLASGVEEFPPLTREQLLAAMRELVAVDGLLIIHAEQAEIIASAVPAAGRGYASFLASRPQAAEQAAIDQVLDAAALTGARVHILHPASAAALPALAAGRARNVRVSVETCCRGPDRRDGAPRAGQRSRALPDPHRRRRGRGNRPHRRNPWQAGPLGWTVPAALGVCVAEPDATVVALSGNYDFQFMIEELAVGAQFQIPYLHVVVNNSYLGLIRQAQRGFDMDYCVQLAFDNVNSPSSTATASTTSRSPKAWVARPSGCSNPRSFRSPSSRHAS